MNRPLVLRLRASADLDAITGRFDSFSHDVTDRFLVRLRNTFEYISRFPEAGTRRAIANDRLAELRSWPIRGYRQFIIFYIVLIDRIEVVRILHGAQDVERIMQSE